MQIYADNAATTKMSETAIEAMTDCVRNWYGNPSSLYTIGQKAKEKLEIAREEIAAVINANPREIIFTSGGSEADNQALLTAALNGKKQGKTHIISSAFEHHAILHTLNKLEKNGFEITLLPVHENGIIRLDELEQAIREDTCLVTIMTANNEIGTIQPIAEIGEICKKHGVLFHTDAVQAVGHLPLDVKAQHIDMLSASAHKFHGPKGVGFLYARKGIILQNLIEGGAQERGKRAGTENLPGIMAMAAALKEAAANMAENNAHLNRRRGHSAPARSKGHLCIIRKRLHLGSARSEPCTACDRQDSRRCARLAAALNRRGYYQRGSGLYHRIRQRGSSASQKLLPRLARPDGRQKRIYLEIGGFFTMALYSDKVMDHFLKPRNLGVIEDADGIGEVGNAKCGDIMKMYLKIDDDIITDVKFETFGCASAIASSSMATELIKGASVEDAMQLTNKAVAEALDGLPAYKMHCSVLAEEAIQAALEDYKSKQAQA